MSDQHRTSEHQLKRDTWHRLSDEQYNKHWLERVAAKSIRLPNGCLVWQGWLQTKGYGGTTYRGENVAIHRQAYKIIANVELATEQFVCHTCDLRACWNFDHLFVGTAKDNNRDCGNKGRHHNGVKTVCKRGHPFSVENTRLRATATTVMRTCLICEEERSNSPEYKAAAADRQRRYQARKRSRVSI